MPRGLLDRLDRYRRLHEQADADWRLAVKVFDVAAVRRQLPAGSLRGIDLDGDVTLGMFASELTVSCHGQAAVYDPRRPRIGALLRLQQVMRQARAQLHRYLDASQTDPGDGADLNRDDGPPPGQAENRSEDLMREALERICATGWPCFAAGERFSTHLHACVREACTALGRAAPANAFTFTGDPAKTVPALADGDHHTALEFISCLRLGDGDPPAGAGAFMLAQRAAHRALGRTYTPPSHMARYR